MGNEPTDTKVQLRCTAQEKTLWQEVAGPGKFSVWAREHLNRAATPPSEEQRVEEIEEGLRKQFDQREGTSRADMERDTVTPAKQAEARDRLADTSPAFGPHLVEAGETIDEKRRAEEKLYEGGDGGAGLREFIATNDTSLLARPGETAEQMVDRAIEAARKVGVFPDDETIRREYHPRHHPAMLDSEWDDAPPEPEDPDLPVAMSTPSHERDASMNRVIAESVFSENERLLVKREPVTLDDDPTIDAVKVTAVPAKAPEPTCTNAAMHWKLVRGEACRFCGGGIA